MVEKRTPGQRIIEGATEALAIARGEQPAAAIWIDGHQYVPAEEIQRLRAEVERLTTENTGLQSDLERACQLINAALDDYRCAVATTMERAAQIVERYGWDNNHLVRIAQNDIAAAIRAEASKKGGEG